MDERTFQKNAEQAMERLTRALYAVEEAAGFEVEQRGGSVVAVASFEPSARVTRQSKRNRSDVVREALRRQLAIQAFEELRKRAAPFAEAAGYLTDEDVYRDVS